MTQNRTEPPSIEFMNVVKTFNRGTKEAVKNLSFSIKKGELFCLIGPNGAGKTTVLKLAAGLLKQDSGEIMICGSARRDRAAASSPAGYVAEEPVFYDNMTGLEFLRFIADMHRIPTGKREQIGILADAFGMRDLLGDPIAMYAFGMRQKLSIMAALLPEPMLLVFDEPFPGLDPLSILAFQGLVADRMKKGAAVLLSTYMMNIAERIADRVGVMAKGVLVENTTLRSLKKKSDKPRLTLEELYLELFK